MTEWIGVVTNTAKQYLKDAVDETMRNRLFLAMLRQKGRISYGHSGYDLNWNVEYDQPLTRDYGDGDDLLFPNHNAFVQASLDWGGAVATDRITEKQRLMNRGNLAIINLFGTKMSRLVKAMTDSFGGELYKDGNATGNELKIDGLETFFGTGTTVAADIVAQPSDTYAGLSTALGNKGGTWAADLATSPNANAATDWPDGKGDVKYDYWSPKILNWSSTNWGTGGTSWMDNCEAVMRRGKTFLTRLGGKQAMPDIVSMDAKMYDELRTVLASRHRELLPHKGATDLGFGDTSINFDGMAVQHEFDAPANTAYFINVDEMELLCLYDQLFDIEGPWEDRKSMSYLYRVGFFGNCRFNPKHFGKAKNYA